MAMAGSASATWRGQPMASLDFDARRFFEQNLTPYAIANGDGARNGLVTGYYEPLLRGSRAAGQRRRAAGAWRAGRPADHRPVGSVP